MAVSFADRGGQRPGGGRASVCALLPRRPSKGHAPAAPAEASHAGAMLSDRASAPTSSAMSAEIWCGEENHRLMWLRRPHTTAEDADLGALRLRTAR